MKRPIIGITMGDPAGIGAEIAVKALTQEDIYERSIPIVIGCKDVIKDALSFIPSNLALNPIKDVDDATGEYGTIDILNLDNIELNDYKYGEVNAVAGQAAIDYIFKGIELAKTDKLEAVVTGPIHKEAINAAGYPYAGHTEIFAEKTNTEDYAMMLAEGNFRVIHVSTHVSLREACDLVKKERVYRVINLADKAMKDLGIKDPRIAVAGLNPHAGENGLFGDEEGKEISPAIKKAEVEGMNVEGPIPPDTVFSKARGGQYDITVVMYHDQGHIPMKTVGFQYDEKNDKWLAVSGVNVTLGLPIIRTSVDHGVAFDKAGEGKANPESMISAIKMAIDFALSRK